MSGKKAKIIPFKKDKKSLLREIQELLILEKELIAKLKSVNPMYYGLPDLLFPKHYAPGVLGEDGKVSRVYKYPDETDEDYYNRQIEAMRDFTENYLFLNKDGVQNKIRLIDPQIRLLTDVFYGYSQKAIAWKCLHPDNLIFTDRGLVEISKVRIGDKVLNGKGDWVDVVCVGRRKHYGHVVSIYINGFPKEYVYTPEHRILTQRGWVEAKDLLLSDILAFPSISGFDFPEKHKLHKIASGNIMSFDVSRNLFPKYWLGLYSHGIRPYVASNFCIYAHRDVDGSTVGKISSIKIKRYDGYVYDIEVSGEHPSFCSPYVVQHNCRGGGGSLVAAILIFLLLIYRQKSVLDLAGSKEQAKIVYNYAKGFLDCFPALKKNLVDGDPLMSETRLKSGVKLCVIASSDKQARGKHEPALFIDEAAQKDRSLDEIFWDVMNGTLNIEDHYIVLWSTFHVPVGFFQEVWDTAKDKGFKRYKWDVFECLKKCEAGMEFATKDDPLSLEYCREKCPLTYKVNDVDDDGNIIGFTYDGCNGKARNSCGWLDRDVVIATKKVNEGTEKFRIEFECKRPEFSGPVFGLGYIEDSIVSQLPKEKEGQGIVGIDWGYATEGAIVLLKDFGNFIGVVDGYCLSRKSLREWIDILERWQKDLSSEPLIVYADMSHQMNNLELEQYGFEVIQVHFNTKVRDYLEGNLLKFFVYKKIKISSHLDRIIWQLKNYRKNPSTGHIIKKDDHGPDALEAAFLHFPFMELYYHEIKARLKKHFTDLDDDDLDEVEVVF